MNTLLDTEADELIKQHLRSFRSFALVAGAGSGKTTSLISALEYLRDIEGARLRRDDKQIACITYTKRAVAVIASRLDWDPIFHVSTLHSYLWEQVKAFTPNILEALVKHVIPQHIAKNEIRSRGNSQRAREAREKIAALTADLTKVPLVPHFAYDDNSRSNYSEGQLNHDDVISVAAWLISNNALLRKVLGQRYPYIFIDEAQDTFEEVVLAINKVCDGSGLPLVGYFGDPMQQIYDKRAGDFSRQLGITPITKVENFRSTPQVIQFLNSFRPDIAQVPAGHNSKVEGSVKLHLIEAEEPEGERRRYSTCQLDRASSRFDDVLQEWGWKNRQDVKYLFLARQMIARRVGFQKLHELFSGDYSSQRSQEAYEKGEHFLLSPFINTLYPLLKANALNDDRQMLDILRSRSPAFDPEGRNAKRTLEYMRKAAGVAVRSLAVLWSKGTTREILEFARYNELCRFSDRLLSHLDRSPREEAFDAQVHSLEKADWLSDQFLALRTGEFAAYVDFVTENTPYSTQHGVKGEQYPNVVVLFDDIEADWSHYSFTKLLTPNTAGTPTDRQHDLSRKLAYVCFSRAEINLRIVLFTPAPTAAAEELLSQGFCSRAQISITSVH